MKCNQLTASFMYKKKWKNYNNNHKHHNHYYDLTKQSLLNPFYVTAKCDFLPDTLLPNQNLYTGIGTHLPTKLVQEVLLYTWKYQHALKLKLVHDDIKDGTICVLQMIRTPQEHYKSR